MKDHKDHKVRLDRNMFNEALSRRVQNAMKERKMSSIDLSKIIGCAASTIRTLRSAKGGLHFYTAIAMFEALDINMEDFLKELQEKNAWERSIKDSENSSSGTESEEDSLEDSLV